MRNGHVVVLCGLVSAAVSMGTSLLVQGDRGSGAPPAAEPTSAPGGLAPATGAPEPVLKGLPPRIEDEVRDLKEAVARLQRDRSDGAAGSQPTPAQAAEVLSRLVSIRQGERLLAIRDATASLIRLGDVAVPGLAEYLRSGKDESYGGGISTTGSTITAYGRLRTVLIDALRQIGTPAAKEALLDIARRSRSFEDYRDLLMMYGSTTDPEMITGISSLVPDILALIAERGPTKAEEQAVFLLMSLARWIQRHRVTAAVPGLAKLVEVGVAEESGRLGDLGALLVDLAPEEAFRIVAGVNDATRRAQVLHGIFLLGGTMGYARRASFATFYDLAFSRLELSQGDRFRLYSLVPTTLSRGLATDEERVADARVLLAFLDERLAIETEERQDGMLSRARDALAKAIEAGAPRR